MNLPRLPQRKRTPRPTKPHLASPWRLFRSALVDYRAGLGRYLKIIGIVAIPMNLLSLLPGPADTSGASSDPLAGFAPFAAIIMNVALIWAINRQAEAGELPTVAQAYYDGSAALVRYLLVSCALVIMLLPAAFGATFYGIGVLGTTAAGASRVEQLLITFVALLLAVPSGYLLVRHVMAPFAAVREGYRPLAALRHSRARTARHFWAIAVRLAAMVIFLILTSIPATLITVVLSLLRLDAVATVFFEIATTLTALPLANLYLFNLYRQLESSQPSSSPTETRA